MKINVHIELLVLEGLAVDARHGSHVRQAVERELAALLAKGEVQDRLLSEGNLDRVQAPGIRIAEGGGPARLGKDIAGAVYGGLGN